MYPGNPMSSRSNRRRVIGTTSTGKPATNRPSVGCRLQIGPVTFRILNELFNIVHQTSSSLTTRMMCCLRTPQIRQPLGTVSELSTSHSRSFPCGTMFPSGLQVNHLKLRGTSETQVFLIWLRPRWGKPLEQQLF